MRSIFRSPLGPYLFANLLAYFATGMQFIILSWFIYRMTGETSSVGYLFIISLVPSIALAPFAGRLADHWNPKFTCVLADAGRAIALLITVLAWKYIQFQPPHLYALAAILAIFDALFNPSAMVVVRRVVGEENLQRANASTTIAIQTGLLSGATLGGAIATFFGFEGAVGIATFLYAGSALLISRVRIGNRLQQAEHGTAAPSGGEFGDRKFQAIRRSVITSPEIRWIVLSQLTAYLTVYSCNTLLPGFVSDVLRGGATHFGVIDAAWGIGAIAAGAMIARVAKQSFGDSQRVLLLSQIVIVAALVAFACSRSAVAALSVYCLMGALTSTVRILTDTALATNVPSNVLGTVKCCGRPKTEPLLKVVPT